ncbi:MAG: transglutaminase family protein [Actinobacteria bacterium]|nr:transglutaminase family protein [Actinomycetota bacterium]
MSGVADVSSTPATKRVDTRGCAGSGADARVPLPRERNRLSLDPRRQVRIVVGRGHSTAGRTAEAYGGRTVLRTFSWRHRNGSPNSIAAVHFNAGNPAEYLVADRIIDGAHPTVSSLARELRNEDLNDVAFSAAAFEYARDKVAHSWDAQDRRVTVSASDTLREHVGLCYCKAHLLTALLRAEGVPAGLCYQRLTDDGESFYVHGLVAVFLEGSWHRLDPRGNKPGVDAQFSLEVERLAWPMRPEMGEVDYPDLFIWPHPAVVAALTQATDMLALCANGLPSTL